MASPGDDLRQVIWEIRQAHGLPFPRPLVFKQPATPLQEAINVLKTVYRDAVVAKLHASDHLFESLTKGKW